MYLMSNSKTSQCGIYELPVKVMALEMGYSTETVEKLLIRFEEYGKIMYCKETKEIFIKNWMKHNKAASPKVRKCVIAELKKVKNKNFVKIFLQICEELGYYFEEIVIDDVYDIEDDVEENHNEKEVKEIKDVKAFAKLYQENIGVANGYVREWLLETSEKIDVVLFKTAIKIAVSKGKCTQGYVNGIIKQWEQNNIRNYEEFKAYMVSLKNAGGGNANANGFGVKREVDEEDEDLYKKPTKEQLDKARSWEQ